MRKVELRMNEQLKYLTIKKLVESNGNKKRAAIELHCTVRSIDRIVPLKVLLRNSVEFCGTPCFH